jgi:hypothetical protein
MVTAAVAAALVQKAAGVEMEIFLLNHTTPVEVTSHGLTAVLAAAVAAAALPVKEERVAAAAAH